MMVFGSNQQLNWDWRAAGNFICGGTGAGVMAMSACGAWLKTPFVEVAALAALASVGLGLFLVWLEIGRPWRFANVFRNPAASWMSREAWIAVALFPVGALGALTGSAVLITIAAGLGLTFLACQALMLRAARGIPTWREAAAAPLIVLTGLTEGAGLLLASLTLAGAAPGWLAMVLLLLAALRTVAMPVYTWRLHRAALPRAKRQELRNLTLLVMIAGGLLPAVLLILPAPGAAAVLAGLLAAASGWTFKYALVCKLALTQGFSIERLPVRGARPTNGSLTLPMR